MEPIPDMPQKEFVADSEPQSSTEPCKTNESKPLHSSIIPPGKCFMPGNAIFSCSRDIDAQSTFVPKEEDWFQGYEKRKVHPMYRTTSAEYGGRAPNVHSMPSKFFPMTQEFSDHLGKCGMYRNHSLNCSLDKNIVPDH